MIIISSLQRMKLRFEEAELFAWRDVQRWDQNPGASGVISEMEISFRPANKEQKRSGVTMTSRAQ